MGPTRTALVALIFTLSIALVSVNGDTAEAIPAESTNQHNKVTSKDKEDKKGQAFTSTKARYDLVRKKNKIKTTLAASTGGGTQTITGPGMPAWLRDCVGSEWTYYEKEAYFANLLHASIDRDSFVPGPGHKADDIWYYMECPESPEALAHSTMLKGTAIFGTWPKNNKPPQVVLDAIVAQSIASIELPYATGDGAPMGTEDIPFITQLPTWLWISEGTWQPHSVTPAPIFGITATTTATPVNVTFASDDEFVDCGPNLGPAYNFNLKEDQQHSDCTLTYRHSSNVADHTLVTTITWAITWSCNLYCGSGTSADMVIPTERDVIVAELQALIVG